MRPIIFRIRPSSAGQIIPRLGALSVSPGANKNAGRERFNLNYAQILALDFFLATSVVDLSTLMISSKEPKREERVRACLSILPLIDSSIPAERAALPWRHRSSKKSRKAAAIRSALFLQTRATTTPWTALKFYCKKNPARRRSGSHEYLYVAPNLQPAREESYEFYFGREMRNHIILFLTHLERRS